MFEDENRRLCFCQVLYFSSVVSEKWMELFSKVALKSATKFGKVVTHFRFWPKDNKTHCSSLQYIKRNQKRLIHAFSSGTFKGIDFYSKDEKLFWLPLNISFVNKDVYLLRETKGKERIFYDNYGTALIRCRTDYLISLTEGATISKQFVFDLKSIVKPAYGVVTIMQQGKDPCSYFRDYAGTTQLTTEEDKEMKAFYREGHRFETIIRDIYWGNVLTKKHWGNDKTKEKHLLKVLEHECQSNIFWIDGETLFFCAPFDICPQEDPKMLDFKKRLYKVFDKLEIEVIRAHLDRYTEPQTESQIGLLQEDINKKPKKLRSKRKLIIRYRMMQNSEPTKEHECVSEILSQAGRLPLIIRPEEKQDGRWAEITVDGRKVPKVRKAIIYCVEKMNMHIEVNPPIDDEDSIAFLNSIIV
jgi:hypothetical protein